MAPLFSLNRFHRGPYSWGHISIWHTHLPNNFKQFSINSLTSVKNQLLGVLTNGKITKQKKYSPTSHSRNSNILTSHWKIQLSIWLMKTIWLLKLWPEDGAKLICFEITCRQSWPRPRWHYTIYMHVLRSIQDEMSRLPADCRLPLAAYRLPYRLLINFINENVITFSRFMTVLHNQEPHTHFILTPVPVSPFPVTCLISSSLLTGILRSLMRQARVAATKAEDARTWNMGSGRGSWLANELSGFKETPFTIY